MNLFKRNLLNFLLACAALLLAQLALADTIEGPAPNFTLKDASGNNMRLSELRGNVILINFWASWCGPCRQEMPLLDELYTQYKPLGFTILGVNVEEDSSQARDMLKKIPVTFPVLFDNENKVSKLYNVVAMPSTVIVDRDGNMRYVHLGYQPGYEQSYQDQVRELVRE